jgi:hypothetical protein
MPFSCVVIKGQPQLTSSEYQSYAVNGQREARDFSTCFSENPVQCRLWRIYRFNLVCGGTTFPWASVAAAARSAARPWLESSSKLIKQPLRWGGRALYDHCPRDSLRGHGGWVGGWMASLCDSSGALAEEPVAEFPEGFAPISDWNGKFVDDGESGENSFQRTKGKGSATSSFNELMVLSPRIQRPSQKGPLASSSGKQAEQLHAHAEMTSKAEVGSQMAKSTVKTATARPIEMTATSRSRLPAREASGSPLDAIPTDPMRPVTGEPIKKADTPIDVASTERARSPGPPSLVNWPTPSILKSHRDPVEPISITRTVVQPVPLFVFSFMALAGLAALQFRTRAKILPISSPDFRSVPPDLSVGRDLIIVRTSQPVRHGIQDTTLSMGALPSTNNDIPETCEQALQILGLTGAPNMSKVAVKKIVNSLRLSWHPDAAISADDHHLRELRMKQINAAWDILNGR